MRIGEVIAGSTAEFVAQCYELHQSPPLGSLVKTREMSVEMFGVVYRAETHSIEPGRRPIVRGEEVEKEADIFHNNPQLAKLLCTDFTSLVVGHQENDTLHHYLPPRPACIHSFVYLCSLDEVRQFSQSLDFLSLLVDARFPSAADEIIAACLRYTSRAHPDPYAFMVQAGKELTPLLGGELRRLNAILKRIRV